MMSPKESFSWATILRPQMSSGRLFLDRVARQQGPSPLHRHPQINTHSQGVQAKGDISTLPGRRHFYFALTPNCSRLKTLTICGNVSQTIHRVQEAACQG